MALSGPPKKLNMISALGQIAALHELHPDKRKSDKQLCKWMERRLGARRQLRSVGRGRGDRHRQSAGIKLAKLPHYDELEFQVRTKKAVLLGKQREAVLLAEYQEWLGRQGRKLQIAKYKRLRCDAFEHERNNLIEAKCSATREYIRMATGQLFEYAYLGRKSFGSPHKAILLPHRPEPQSLEWLTDLNISVIWKEGKVFLDNANGQFS
jgi:hypothetical protein